MQSFLAYIAHAYLHCICSMHMHICIVQKNCQINVLHILNIHNVQKSVKLIYCIYTVCSDILHIVHTYLHCAKISQINICIVLKSN